MTRTEQEWQEIKQLEIAISKLATMHSYREIRPDYTNEREALEYGMQGRMRELEQQLELKFGG